MSFLDELSQAFVPHTQHMTNAISEYLRQIAEDLNHLRSYTEANLGSPGTTSSFNHFIFKGEVLAPGRYSLKEFCNKEDEPTLGEDWTLESLAVNGVIAKSPPFAVRTNTGRLLIAVVKEGTGLEKMSGDVVIKQGERIEIELLEAGKLDFTLTTVKHKHPRTVSTPAGFGVSAEVWNSQSMHEPERDFSPAFDRQLHV